MPTTTQLRTGCCFLTMGIILTALSNSTQARDQTGTVRVDARASVFGAGNSVTPGGLEPVRIPLLSGLSRVLVVTNVTGQVRPWNGVPMFSPDGGPFSGFTVDIQEHAGIAGVLDRSTNSCLALLGLFQGTNAATPLPSRLDLTLTKTQSVFVALLNQPFHIGDGLTGRTSGERQIFPVPDEATDLYLGFADAHNFHGSPGSYIDNEGTLEATYLITTDPEYLADAYTKARHPTRAIPLWERVLAQQKETPGKTQDNTFAAMEALAGCYWSVRRTNDAIELRKDQLNLQTVRLGADHPTTLATMDKLANLHWSSRQNNPDSNYLSLKEQAFKHREAKLGANHPDTMATLQLIAHAKWLNKDYEDAVARWKELLQQRRTRPAEQTNLVGTLSWLGRGYTALERHREAEEAYAEALEISRRVWTNNPTRILGPLRDLANSLDQQSKTIELKKLFGELLTPETVSKEESNSLLQFRGDFHVLKLRWNEAAADFLQALENKPRDIENWKNLAPTLIKAGDVSAYHALRDAMVACGDLFPTNRLGFDREAVVDVYLLMPISKATPAIAYKLEKIFGEIKRDANESKAAISAGSATNTFSARLERIRRSARLHRMGVLEYRQGLYAQAVETLQQAADARPSTSSNYTDAVRRFVMAMAMDQSGQKEEARSTFEQGVVMLRTHLPARDGAASFADRLNALLDNWSSPATAQIFEQEARALLEGKSGQDILPAPATDSELTHRIRRIHQKLNP